MIRTNWGENLNAARPTPFNRSTGPLVYLDNLLGKWGEWSDEVMQWASPDEVRQPYRMWTLSSSCTPTIDRSDSEIEFLVKPIPTYIKGSGALYLRNLDVNVASFTITTIGEGISLGASTLVPVYDIDEPIYVSQDAWESWAEVTPFTINTIYGSLATGAVQVAYRLSTPVLSSVAGVTTATPAFLPIYNAVDEYGDLYSLPRIWGEGNTAYLSRIKSKLGAIGSADATGVAIETARRLGSLDIIDWNYNRVAGSYLIRIQDRGDGITNYASVSGATISSTGGSINWGLRRTCLSLSGGTSCYTVPWVDGMDYYTNTRIASWMWVNASSVTSATPQTLLSCGDLNLQICSSAVDLVLGTAATISGAISTGWHCVSFYYIGNYLSLGIDGVEVGSNTSVNWELSEDDWTIGLGFTGDIDELCVSTDIVRTHKEYYSQVVLTDGWPVLVGGPYGNIPSCTYIQGEKLTQRTTGDWRASAYMRDPYLCYEGSRGDNEYITDATLSSGIASLPAWVVNPCADYTIRWWYGALAVIPDELPPGQYKVYVARDVMVDSLKDYREDNLTDQRGLLTTEGRALIQSLGNLISWDTLTWGQNLYFYGSEPPFAPTPTTWDQNLTYPEL